MPFACNKGPIQYTFEGKITESVSHSACSGAEIKLYQKLIVNGAASESFSFAASTVTDNAGTFTIAIDRDKVTAFKLTITKANYFPISIEKSSSVISTENPNQFNEELDPISWVSFQIKNSFPTDSDHFKLITQTFREDCDGCATNGAFDFYGPLDTTITYATTGGEYVKFIYINVSAGSSTFDSIYTTPFETIIYPIFY